MTDQPYTVERHLTCLRLRIAKLSRAIDAIDDDDVKAILERSRAIAQANLEFVLSEKNYLDND
jgi:hypothetical protein